MPPRTYARKVDENQPQIVAALRAIGVSVWIIGEPVDLMIGYRGRTGAIEIKDGSKPPSERKLTPQQKDFFLMDRGFHRVVCDVEEALHAAQELVA